MSWSRTCPARTGSGRPLRRSGPVGTRHTRSHCRSRRGPSRNWYSSAHKCGDCSRTGWARPLRRPVALDIPRSRARPRIDPTPARSSRPATRRFWACKGSCRSDSGRRRHSEAHPRTLRIAQYHRSRPAPCRTGLRAPHNCAARTQMRPSPSSRRCRHPHRSPGPLTGGPPPATRAALGGRGSTSRDHVRANASSSRIYHGTGRTVGLPASRRTGAAFQDFRTCQAPRHAPAFDARFRVYERDRLRA